MCNCLRHSVVVAAMLACSLSAMAQDAIRSDARLPPDVLFYLTGTDLPTTYDSFKNTAYGQLINGPEMEEFRVQLLENFQNEIGSDILEFEDELGMPVSDLAALVEGEASLAIVRPVGQLLGAVVFFEFGDHRDILDKAIEAAEKQILQNGGVLKSESEYVDTGLTTYRVLTENTVYSEIDVTSFVKDGYFILASSRAIAESVLDRWDGQHNATFADDVYYSKMLERCATTDGSEADLIYFANPVRMVLSVVELIPQAQIVAGMLPLYLPTLGLNKLHGGGMALEVDADEFSFVSRSLLCVSRPPTGVLRMFQMPATVENPATWVPATATQYMGGNWDIGAAYAAVQSLYDGFLGVGAFDRQVTDLTRQANQNNLHPKKDVIDVLSGAAQGYYQQKLVEEEVVIDFGVSIGVTDAEKAWRLLEAVVSTEANGDEVMVRDQKVLTFTTPDDRTVMATVFDNQIVFASDQPILSSILKNESIGPALVDNAEFQRVRKHAPDSVSLLSFQSAAGQLRDPYEKLRNGDFDAAIEGRLDFSTLPKFEEIEKYLVPTFSYVVPDDEGAYSQKMGMKPAEK